MPIRKNPRIFISYARSDGRAFARDLRRRLTEDHGLAVWQDLSELEGGKDWWKQIEAAIRHRDLEYLVLVMTASSLRSEVVRDEWRLARQEGKCVIPVVGAEAAKAQIASLPGWMKAAHFVDTAQDEQWQRFIRTLESPCQQARVPMMAPPPADFVPRPQEFEALRSLLLSQADGMRVSITAALKGAGGYGKTTLAKALCHDEAVQERFHHGILWVTLGETPDLTRQVLDLIEVLTGVRPGYEDVGAASARLGELLSTNAYLLVIDDVWKRAHVEPFLRDGPRCGRLITTRNSDTLPQESQHVQVDAMKGSEAVSLLRAGLPPGEPDRIEALAARLGEWPLLLKLVNGVLAQRIAANQPLRAALDYVGKALDKRGLAAFDATDEADRDRAVEANLSLSLELLTVEQRRCFAELAVFPEDVDIPFGMVQRLWSATAALDEVDTEDLCERLFRLSLLLDLNLATRSLRLHDVIRSLLERSNAAHVAAWHSRLLESAGVTHWAELPHEEQYLWRHLPYHLKGASREAELRSLLLDFDWLRAKLAAAGINALLADFESVPGDVTLMQLRHALRTAAHILGREPQQLASQLLARLTADVPEIAALLERAKTRHAGNWLRPRTPSLISDPALLCTLEGHANWVQTVAITPDGKRAVSGSGDNTLKVWELETGALLRTLEGHASRIDALAISPDGKRALSSAGTLKVWELETGVLLRTLEGYAGMVEALAITPDGKRALSGCRDGTLMVWELETGALLRTLEWDADGIEALAITPDGKRAVSGSLDKTVKVWELETSELLRTLKGHADRIEALAITPDGKRAVSGSRDGALKVWELETGGLLRTLEAHADWIEALAITPDGKRAGSSSWDGTLKVWELETGGLLRTLKGHTERVEALAITPDGKRAVSGSCDRTLKVWQLEAGAPLRMLEGDAGGVKALVITPDGKQAVSGSWDSTVKIWELETGGLLRTLEGHADWNHAVAITPDGKRAVSGAGDNTLKVWELETGALLRTLEGHLGVVEALAITPDGKRALSASQDGTLKVWELETGALLRTLEWDADGIGALAITPDGKRAVSGSSDRTVKVWELETSGLLRTLKGHADRIEALAITADGKRAVSGSWDGALKVWELETGGLLRTLEAHADGIEALAITPDGKRAISGSWDKTLKVWQLESGTLVASWSVDAAIPRCAVSPDGRSIVAADNAGRMHFLELVARESHARMGRYPLSLRAVLAGARALLTLPFH